MSLRPDADEMVLMDHPYAPSLRPWRENNLPSSRPQRQPSPVSRPQRPPSPVSRAPVFRPEARIDKLGPEINLNTENGDDCVICLQKLGEKTIRARKTCGHVFHAECIDDFHRRNPNATCPICRVTQSRRRVKQSTKRRNTKRKRSTNRRR